MASLKRCVGGQRPLWRIVELSFIWEQEKNLGLNFMWKVGLLRKSY
jgi:hypothetical protein